MTRGQLSSDAQQRRSLPPWLQLDRLEAPLFLAAALAIYAVFQSRLLLLALGLAALIIFAVTALFPTLALTTIVVTIFSLEALAGWGLLPRAATWLSDLMLLALAAHLTVRVAVGGQKLRGSFWYVDIWLPLIALVFFLTALGNPQSPLIWFFGIRVNLKHLFLFYLLINSTLPNAALQRLLALSWGLFFLQPIFVFAQWFLSDCRNCYVDSYSGTLGSTATLAITAGMAGSLALAAYVEREQKLYALLTLPVALSLGLADAKAGLWFLALVITALMAYRFLASRKKQVLRRFLLPMAVFGAGLYAALFFASRNLGLDLFNLFTDVQSAARYDWIYDPDTGREIGRTFDLQLALRVLPDLPYDGLLGAGPGAASPGISERFSGNVYQEYVQRINRTVFWVPLGRLLVEFGYIGVGVFMGLFGSLLLMAHRAYRTLQQPEQKAHALAFMGYVLVFVAAHIYQTIDDVPNFIFWLSAALLVRYCHDMRPASTPPPHA